MRAADFCQGQGDIQSSADISPSKPGIWELLDKAELLQVPLLFFLNISPTYVPNYFLEMLLMVFFTSHSK